MISKSTIFMGFLCDRVSDIIVTPNLTSRWFLSGACALSCVFTRICPVWSFIFLTYKIISFGYLRHIKLVGKLSKTSEFPIDVLEIKFHFGNAKIFWTRWRNSVVKSCSLFRPKRFGIPKIKLDFQNYQLGIQMFRSSDPKPNFPQDQKSDNLQYNMLGRWDKRLIDQAFDVPSIIFFS